MSVDQSQPDKKAVATSLVRQLREQGFAAYFAGGCVRDRMLGVEAKDYDIATDARPEVIQRLFPNTVAVGARFGVIVVISDGMPFEVATFRADAPYLDGRRPSAVRFGTLAEDAARRDFTIGGMYYDPLGDEVIDLVGGRADLRAGIVRAIGDPAERFAEDRLRMLRGVRFAARLGFEIEPRTWQAIAAHADAIGAVSAERIGDELVMIMTEGSPAHGMELLRQCGLMHQIVPELEPLAQCAQPANFHPEGDVWRHTLLALSMLEYGCSETLAFGLLFHDIAKPPCRAESEGKVTFHGHTERGAEMATAILQRLKRSRFIQERVAYLVRYHLRLTMAPRMRPSTLKRMLAEEGFEELLELSWYDALASNSYLGFYHFCRQALAARQPQALREARLINGRDLIELGFTPGPRFKTILREVEDLQLDGQLRDRQQALAYVRRRHGGQSSS
jgi:poly(A) polymerase